MKRTNEQWLSELMETGNVQQAAISDLQAIIHSFLPFALSKWLPNDSPQRDELVEDTTQETLLRVLDQLDSFEGRSQFTTWVHKIAVRIALTELRRRKWRDISLEYLMEKGSGNILPNLLANPGIDPELSSEQREIVDLIKRMIREELTEKQRKALVAITVHNMPLDELARRMKTNRNALYKLMHDARLRLKKGLAREGLSPETIINAFT